MNHLKLGIMRTLFAFVISVFMISNLNAQDEQADKADAKAIKKVIQTAYIDGIHNLGDIDEIEKGFHPGFNLLIKDRHNHLQKLPIYNWIESTKKHKAENPNGPKDKTTVEFVDIDITEGAATAKIDLFRGGNRIYTDYLMLYNFDGQWRIVGKIYHGYK